MSRCKWMTDERDPFDGICVNDKCPMCADYCPVVNCPELCMYAETEERKEVPRWDGPQV